MAIVYDADGVAGKICNKCDKWKPVTEFSLQTANLRKGGDGYYYTCKKCHNAIRRIQRAANREIFNARQRAHYQTHRADIIAANHAYRTANPEKVKATNRAYYYRNREQRRQAQRVRNVRRRALQRDQVRAYYRAYYRTQKQTDFEKVRRHERKQERRRRNRKAQAIGFHTEDEWVSLKLQYNYTCLRCRRCEPDIMLTRDHIVPLAQGGTDWIDNIQPLCGSCNSSKNDTTHDYRIDWLSE